jgi:anti-sigma-K factor RskA
MSEKHDCAGDAAAYVLGALSKEEAEAFTKHLVGCIVCRDEVAALQQVAEALPIAAPQYEAPKELRRRVMQAVAAEPRGAGVGAPRRRSLWRGSSSVLIPRQALAAGLAVVIVALVVGGILIASGGSGGTTTFRASVGSAEVRVSGGRGELIIDHLPAPPPGHIYEVWLKRPGRAPSPTSTLFSVTSRGTGEVGLPGSLRGVEEVLVTPEPDGGSLAPTHVPVIVAPLRSSE